MNTEGRFEFSDFLSFVEHEGNLVLDCAHSEEDLEAIRQLSNRYRSKLSHDNSLAKLNSASSFNSLDNIRALACDFKIEERKFRRNKLKTINNIEQLRIALFKKDHNVEIISWDENTVTLKAPKLSKLPRLPLNYAYKGGASRLALLAALGKNTKNRVPRDLDIFRVGKEATAEDSKVAKQFMPDDFKHGSGVELVSDYENYLRTRDLTINQVALVEDKIICSYSAIEDSMNYILRPTPHVTDSNGLAQGKITMKTLRMRAESLLEGDIAVLSEERHNPRVSMFDIALHLERSLTRGTRAAQYYISECVRLGYLTDDKMKSPIGDTIHTLQKKIRKSPTQSRKLGRLRAIRSN